MVTGSGTGIGREIALEFGREGADVVLHYGHSAAGAKSAAEAIRAMGRKSVAVKANFEGAEEALNLAYRAIEFLGCIDSLVNNSGITTNKPFLKVTLEQYDTLMNVNLRSPFVLTQAVVEHMLALAAFLCSEDAGFIVGQTFVVDGGTASLMSLISDFSRESPARFGIGYVPGV